MNALSKKALLQAHDLCQKKRVNHVNLKLYAGRLAVILGMNGAGKSSVLHLLAGLSTACSGTILLQDKDLKSYSVRQRAAQVSLCPQQTTWDFDFSVYDFVAMGCYAQPQLNQIEQQDVIQNALQQTQLTALSASSVCELSGGEQRRALIARNLSSQAAVLLLDEPVAHLDLQQQNNILTLCRDLAHQQGRAVLCVLHDLNAAWHYADEVYLMQQGQIIYQGTPQQVLTPERIAEIFKVQAVLVNDGQHQVWMTR